MRRHLLALMLVPVVIAGVTLAARPATAGHSVDGVELATESDSGWPGDEDLEVTITGTFDAAEEPYECTFFGDDITTDSCEFQDPDLVATIDIDGEAAPGERTVTVSHDDGTGGSESSACTDCFTVNGPIEVDPPEGEQGEEELEVDISGAGFDDTDADSATCDFGDGIDVGDEGDRACEIVVVNEGEADEETVVRATISISDEAEESARDVTVTISDSTAVPPPGDIGSGTCVDCFTVAAAQAEPTPTPTPDPTPTPTPAPTPTPTATSTATPIDTEEVDPDDGDAESSDARLPATGLDGARTFGVAGLGMLGAGLGLLGWRRRWTRRGAGAR